MTVICVGSTVRKDTIRKFLEAQKSPAYRFVKKKSFAEQLFEVTREEGIGDIAAHTGRLIRNTDWGKDLYLQIKIEDPKH